MCATCGCDSDHDHGHDHPREHAHPHEHAHVNEPGLHGHSAHRHLERDRAFSNGLASRREAIDMRPARTVRIEQDVLAKNDALAARNRAFFRARGILALNLTSAPGSGKTTLLEKIAPRLRSRVPVSVIEGDQETERDAARIRASGCRALQINTGAGCHLDAEMVRRGVETLDPPDGSVLFIENVGNLVCPALFDLGEHAMVVVMSVTEGEDKPLKYPHMFRAADAVVLGKMDLLPSLDFDIDECLGHLGRVNPNARIFMVSALKETGLDDFVGWLMSERGLFARAAVAP